MKRCLVVVAVAAVAVSNAAAAATPAEITALAANGGSIAYATAWTSRACERVVLRGVRAFPTGQCPEVSTGRGVASVSVAGKRVVWLAYAGGNIREWSLLTATPTRPKPRLLRFAARDVDLGSPIVLGSAGGVIPYAIGRTVVALRPDGSRAFEWTAPAPVRALAASGEVVAVVEQGGAVTLVRRGASVRTIRFDGEADAVALAGGTIVLQRGHLLDVRVGNTSRTWTLPLHAQLQDADARAAVYVVGRTIRVVRFLPGSDDVVGPGNLAQIDRGRIVVAFGSQVS